jgi:hypothetical protein
MNNNISVLAQIRAKKILNNGGAASQEDAPPAFDMDAEIAKAVWEVSQPDVLSPQETVSEVGASNHAPAPRPVSTMSVRHQRRVGLPIVRVDRALAKKQEPGLLERIRRCRVMLVKDQEEQK